MESLSIGRRNLEPIRTGSFGLDVTRRLICVFHPAEELLYPIECAPLERGK
jgi:hypothetical protein